MSDMKLGGRLPLLKPETLDGKQKDVYDRLHSTLVVWAEANKWQAKTKDGELIGPMNAFLYSPAVSDGFLQWMEANGRHNSLSKRVQEVLILSVGAIWKSPFELYAHTAMARAAGLPEEAIQALVEGSSPETLTSDEQVAHRFAHQLAVAHRISPELYREAEAAFGRNGLVDMVYVVGLYLFTCALLNAFEIPAPEQAAGSKA